MREVITSPARVAPVPMQQDLTARVRDLCERALAVMATLRDGAAVANAATVRSPLI